jgi:hypothetical protein
VAESVFNTKVSTSVVNRVNPHNVAAASNQPPCCVGAYVSSNPTHKGAVFSVVLTNSYLGTNYTAISRNSRMNQ